MCTFSDNRKKASGERKIKDLREGSETNWQEATADGMCKVEPVGLASERKRPIHLVNGNLVSRTVLDT